MATYKSSFGKLFKPSPPHSLTPAALAAVESMKRIGAERRVHRMVYGWNDGRGVARGGIVTKHGNPKASAWEGEPITRNARSLLALAEAQGFTAHLLVNGEHCAVEGYRLEPEKVGFRALWTRGGAAGFSWCTPWRYELQADHRSIGVDQKARTGKVGYRSAGMGAERLAIVGTPWGMKVTWGELQARVRAVGS